METTDEAATEDPVTPRSSFSPFFLARVVPHCTMHNNPTMHCLINMQFPSSGTARHSITLMTGEYRSFSLLLCEKQSFASCLQSPQDARPRRPQLESGSTLHLLHHQWMTNSLLLSCLFSMAALR
jgi:hypothetical protein